MNEMKHRKAESAELQNIIIEEGKCGNMKRYILPPTPESYAFIENQIKKDSTLAESQTFFDFLTSADENTKNRIFEVLTIDREIGKFRQQ